MSIIIHIDNNETYISVKAKVIQGPGLTHPCNLK